MLTDFYQNIKAISCSKLPSVELVKPHDNNSLI